MFYRVNFTYVNDTGYIRAGALVVDAKDIEHSKTIAMSRLEGKHSMINISSVAPYQTTQVTTKK